MKPTMLDRMIPDTGKIHQNQEIWNIRGGCPTIKATHYKDPPKVLIKEKTGVHQASD